MSLAVGFERVVLIFMAGQRLTMNVQVRTYDGLLAPYRVRAAPCSPHHLRVRPARRHVPARLAAHDHEGSSACTQHIDGNRSCGCSRRITRSRSTRAAWVRCRSRSSSSGTRPTARSSTAKTPSSPVVPLGVRLASHHPDTSPGAPYGKPQIPGHIASGPQVGRSDQYWISTLGTVALSDRPP
jgi:hypothetical protein